MVKLKELNKIEQVETIMKGNSSQEIQVGGN